jgi:hypothetical protein
VSFAVIQVYVSQDLYLPENNWLQSCNPAMANVPVIFKTQYLIITKIRNKNMFDLNT